MSLRRMTIVHIAELREWETFISDDLLCIRGKLYGHRLYGDGFDETVKDITMTQSGDIYNIGHGHGDMRVYYLAKESTKKHGW